MDVAPVGSRSDKLQYRSGGTVGHDNAVHASMAMVMAGARPFS